MAEPATASGSAAAPRSVPAYNVAEGRCHHCGRAKWTWTPGRILAAFRAFAAEHGRAPFQREWRTASWAHPSHATVYEVFGSWRGALEQAGLDPPLRSNTRRNWTRDEVIQAIFDWKFHTGRLPRALEWTGQTDWRPSEGQVRRLFGTWNAALVAAGYEPTRVKRAA